MNNNLLNNLLNKTSKSLNIINEIIPIYKDTSPTIKKIKNFIINKSSQEKTIKKDEIKKEKEPTPSNSNPKFFV